MNTRGRQDETRDARMNIRESFFNARGRRDKTRDARMNIHEGFFNPRESFFDRDRASGFRYNVARMGGNP